MSATTSEIRRVEGRGIPVRGDDIDTDRIIPARFLRCVTFAGIGEHAFADDRQQAGGKHPFDRKEFAGASVLVVNANFGCGSSREHAPQSLVGWGVRAVLGESFAEIFFGNCVALGVPCLTLAADDIERIQDALEADPTARIVVDVDDCSVGVGTRKYRGTLADGVRRALASGVWDSLALLLADPAEVDRVASALPYVGWSAVV